LKIYYLNYATLGTISLGMIIFALVSQYVYGHHPCTLCLQQRYPHILIVALCCIIFIFQKNIFTIHLLNLLLIGISISLSFYHVGVENSLFIGPSACSPQDLSGIIDKNTQELLDNILSKPITSCKAVSWSFLTLSMATWNFILSIILFFCWTFCLTRLLKPHSSNSTSQ